MCIKICFQYNDIKTCHTILISTVCSRSKVFKSNVKSYLRKFCHAKLIFLLLIQYVPLQFIDIYRCQMSGTHANIDCITY